MSIEWSADDVISSLFAPIVDVSTSPDVDHDAAGRVSISEDSGRAERRHGEPRRVTADRHANGCHIVMFIRRGEQQFFRSLFGVSRWESMLHAKIA